MAGCLQEAGSQPFSLIGRIALAACVVVSHWRNAEKKNRKALSRIAGNTNVRLGAMASQRRYGLNKEKTGVLRENQVGWTHLPRSESIVLRAGQLPLGLRKSLVLSGINKKALDNKTAMLQSKTVWQPHHERERRF